MNVFLPFQRDKNPVLDEIEQFFEGKFIYDQYQRFDQYNIDVVNIHWPESIFNFKEPNQQDLESLEEELKKWKTKSRIVYTRHNVLPHKNQSEKFIKLYQLILNYADGIIHLGQYSKNELQQSFPNSGKTPSIVIYHPAYTLFKNEISSGDARKHFGIPADKKVILVFGSVRTNDELKLILTAFEKLNIAKKHLLISHLNIYKSLPKTLGQRVSKFMNTQLEKFTYRLKGNLTMNYSFVENSDVQKYLNAADILFIPRINLLNSGNLFLGFSFKKIVVGPAIGNLKEFLEKTGNPTYDPQDISSVTNALAKGLELPPEKGIENYNFVSVHCQPKAIAQSYYQFFHQIKNLA